MFSKRRPAQLPPLRLGEMTFPWTSEVKYLGLRLTTTLNYSPHIKCQIGNALGTLIKLFPLLSKYSTLTTSTKFLLYKTSIRSILSYAAPVWCSISDSTYKQLRTLVGNLQLNTLYSVLSLCLFILLPVETCFILTNFKQIKELERDLTLQRFQAKCIASAANWRRNLQQITNYGNHWTKIIFV
jgi:hypothetical protein